MGARNRKQTAQDLPARPRAGVAVQGPGQVRQEIYGYLLAHYAISALICKAATEAGIDPDRVKFKPTVRIVRRWAADPAAFPPEQHERILTQVKVGIARTKHLNAKRRHRTCPRVVKRARHNSYRVKRPGDHGARHNGPATISPVNHRQLTLAA